MSISSTSRVIATANTPSENASRRALLTRPSLRREREHPGLEVEQVPLAVQPAAVAGEAAVRADDPVAGHDDRDRVAAVGGADRPRPVRAPDLPGDLAVAARLAVRDRGQRLPHAAQERRAVQREGEGELVALAREVLVELGAGRGEGLVGPLPVRADAERGHVQAAEVGLVAGEQELADGAGMSGVEHQATNA